MFVKDVVLLACRELGLSEVADEIKSKATESGSDGEDAKNKNIIENTESESAVNESQSASSESAENESVVSSDTKTDFSDGVKTEIERIIESLNLAVETIVSSESSLIMEETVTTDAEGKVSLSDFSRGVYMVVDVIDEASGNSADFLLMPFHLYLPNKNTKYKVRFKAGSKKVSSLDDKIEIPPYIGVGVITRAVVYEYLLSKNCYNEATFWKESYEDALCRAKIKNKKYRFKSCGIV